jgi:uncharacterized tellurite resistance protein B-like protein
MSETPGALEDSLKGLLEVMTLMVRADGTVDHDEILHFMETIGQQAPFDAIANEHLFRLAQQVGGKALDADLLGHLGRLKEVLAPDLRLKAYELAWQLSGADGNEHEHERALLTKIQQAFELSAEQIRAIEEA